MTFSCCNFSFQYCQNVVLGSIRLVLGWEIEHHLSDSWQLEEKNRFNCLCIRIPRTQIHGIFEKISWNQPLTDCKNVMWNMKTVNAQYFLDSSHSFHFALFIYLFLILFMELYQSDVLRKANHQKSQRNRLFYKGSRHSKMHSLGWFLLWCKVCPSTLNRW